MKNKFKFGVIGALALSVVSSFIAPNAAKANDLDPHSYWQVRTQYLPLHGTYFVSQNTGEDISSFDGFSIMTKEQWLDFSYNTGYEWIESGTLAGAVRTGFGSTTPNRNYKGAFVAFNSCSGLNSTQCNSFTNFQQTPIGNNSNLTGKHNFIIRKSTTSNFWDCYLDYTLLVSISRSQFTQQEPTSATLGIESSDTRNFYTSGTLAYDWWIVDPANETNQNAGWLPVDSNHRVIGYPGQNYLNGYLGYQYPYNNGTTVPGGAVTASNRITWYR